MFPFQPPYPHYRIYCYNVFHAESFTRFFFLPVPVAFFLNHLHLMVLLFFLSENFDSCKLQEKLLLGENSPEGFKKQSGKIAPRPGHYLTWQSEVLSPNCDFLVVTTEGPCKSKNSPVG